MLSDTLLKNRCDTYKFTFKRELCNFINGNGKYWENYKHEPGAQQSEATGNRSNARG